MLKKFEYIGEGAMIIEKQRVSKKGDTIEIEVNEKKIFTHKDFKPVGTGQKKEKKDGGN